MSITTPERTLTSMGWVEFAGQNARVLVMSEQECLTCGEKGHTYVAHWGLLGLSPALTPGFVVTDGPKPPDVPTEER